MAWTSQATLVVTFVTVVLLVSAGTTALAVSQARERIADDDRTAREAAAQGIASEIDAFIVSAGRSLEAASALLKATDLRPQLDSDALARAFGPLIAYSGAIDAVVVVDDQMRAVWALPGTWVKPSATLPPAAPAPTTPNGNILVLGAVDQTSYWIVPIESRTGYPSRFHAAGRLDETPIRSILFSKVRGSEEALVLSRDGVVVQATGPDATAAWNEARPPTSTDNPDRAARLEFDSQALGTQVRLASVALAGGAGSVVLMGDSAFVESVQAQTVRAGLVAGAAIGGVAMIGGVVVARHVTQPLKRVARAAAALKEGDFSARAEPKGPRETRLLAESFNLMAIQLQRSFTILEERVRERTAQLEDRNRELDAFAHVVSHDLKAPLRGVRLHAEMLGEKLGSRLAADARQHLQLLKDRVGRMGSMIDGVLDYAQVGRAPELETRVDTNQLIKEVIGLASPPSGFEVHVQRGMPELVAPRVRLQQVFQNLIGNAIKHHDRPKGSIHVSATSTADWVEFFVEDDGPGIPPYRREAMFKLFEARDRSKPDSSGVGLPMALRIVESHGGRLQYQALPGRGSRFSVLWPAKDLPAETPRAVGRKGEQGRHENDGRVDSTPNGRNRGGETSSHAAGLRAAGPGNGSGSEHATTEIVSSRARPRLQSRLGRPSRRNGGRKT